MFTYGEGRPLLYLHGGGYTGDVDARHFLLCRRIARRTGVRVLMPQYPLAPEHTWRDSHAAMVSLAASLGDFDLAGDSAGGGYALSVAQGLRDAGHAQPRRMVLIAPWVDLRGTTPGIEEAAANDPWLRLDWLHLYAGWWAGSEADLSRPEVSPALGDLTGLARTLTLCGTRDLLHPENVVLARRAAEAGWDDTLVEAPGLLHVYPILPIPEARPALKRICAFLADS